MEKEINRTENKNIQEEDYLNDLSEEDLKIIQIYTEHNEAS
jgi:hypothetical protein